MAPPRISVLKQFHNGLNDVLADLQETGFWPTTFVSPPSDPPDIHWHDMETHGYVMDGTTWILDGETGERLTVEPGDKLVIPPGALHIEGRSEGPVTYVVAIPDTRPFFEAFQLRPADDPKRPTG